MKFRPLHDRVVVKRVEEDTKTKGGIIIPDTAQEKPMQGEVIAVGPGVTYVQMSGMGEGGPWSGFVTYAPTIHAIFCPLGDQAGLPAL